MILKNIWPLLKETFNAWNGERTRTMAAALSYYTVFSFAPLLIIAMAITGQVFGEADMQRYIFAQLQATIGQESAQTLFGMIKGAFKPSTGIIATVVGVATLLLGAAIVFDQLQTSLNAIWEVKVKTRRFVTSLIRERLLSFLMILVVGALLLMSLLVSTSLAALGHVLSGYMSELKFVFQVLDFVVSVMITTFLFAMIFKILPDVKSQWNDVWIGAIATALLFSIGKILIGMYLGIRSLASAYGAAGSLVVLLLWVYYSAQIFFFGAELTHVYATKYGSDPSPDKNAVVVSNPPR